MKTILITGGAGFIGSNFVWHISNNYPDYKITVLDALTYAGNLENFIGTLKNNPKFSFHYGNVRNAELVDDLVSRADVVFHFAAESHVARSIFDNMVFFETDVIGTQVVANSVLKTFQNCRKVRSYFLFRSLRNSNRRTNDRGAPVESSNPLCKR